MKQDEAIRAMDAPSYIGSNLPWKTTEDGRFVLYKYNPQVRGDSMVKDNLYLVMDTLTGKRMGFETLAYVFSFIVWARTGEQTSPWFCSTKAAATKEKLVKHVAFEDNFGTKQRRGW